MRKPFFSRKNLFSLQDKNVIFIQKSDESGIQDPDNVLLKNSIMQSGN